MYHPLFLSFLDCTQQSIYTSKKIVMHLKIILFLFFVTGVLLSGQAQSQFSGWFAAFNTFKLKNNFTFYNDVQVRSNNQLQHMQTLILRRCFKIYVGV